MKTNARAKKQKANQSTTTGAATDPSFIASAGTDHKKTSLPDYSSMYAEVEKIKHPVTFESLRVFYGLVAEPGVN